MLTNPDTDLILRKTHCPQKIVQFSSITLQCIHDEYFWIKGGTGLQNVDRAMDWTLYSIMDLIFGLQFKGQRSRSKYPGHIACFDILSCHQPLPHCNDGTFHKYTFTVEGNCFRESFDMFVDVCYHPYLVSMLFADLLSLHLVTFFL